jgi:hypothetical protein
MPAFALVVQIFKFNRQFELFPDETIKARTRFDGVVDV